MGIWSLILLGNRENRQLRISPSGSKGIGVLPHHALVRAANSIFPCSQMEQAVRLAVGGLATSSEGFEA